MISRARRSRKANGGIYDPTRRRMMDAFARAAVALSNEGYGFAIRTWRSANPWALRLREKRIETPLQGSRTVETGSIAGGLKVIRQGRSLTCRSQSRTSSPIMMRRGLVFVILAFVLAGPVSLDAQADVPFHLANGDRVVLLGNAFIEHERFHGFLEANLRRHFPTAKLTFRNLGWSGDTIRGEARTSGYQNPEGMPRLLKEVKSLTPTVLFIGYGMNESFAGQAGLTDFVKGYEKLLDDLKPLKARIVILSPTWHENLGPPLPDAAQHNRSLAAYTEALKTLAVARNAAFVDLFRALADAKNAAPAQALTSNGILLNETGYWHAAAAVEKLLGLPTTPSVELRASAKGVKVTRLMSSPLTGTEKVVVTIRGLPEGRHILKLSGASLATATAADWERGVPLPAGPFVEDIESLRKAIVLRNDLFYRGWRPFNDHSRHWGFMAKDFERFADLAHRQDEVIDGLRYGRESSLEVTPEVKK
jgi:lysophospholipase L1-like esterase